MSLPRLVLCIAIASAAYAQGLPPRRPLARAVGDATITAAPDQAMVNFSIETRANTAQDAAAQNATQTTSVLAALQALLGAGADIRTVGYSVSPIYTFPGGGQTVLSGFSASNSIQVTTSNLVQVGKLLDTGTQAGATRVQGLTFGLKDPEPLRLQALRMAAQKARTHAEAMAAGAGLHLGAVMSLDESGSTPRVITPVLSAAPAGGVPTPIDPGTVSVSATVTMEIELIP